MSLQLRWDLYRTYETETRDLESIKPCVSSAR
jgi:hypothetical protein